MTKNKLVYKFNTYSYYLFWAQAQLSSNPKPPMSNKLLNKKYF